MARYSYMQVTTSFGPAVIKADNETGESWVMYHNQWERIEESSRLTSAEAEGDDVIFGVGGIRES